MKPIRTWILVADGARARFLENHGPGKGLEAALDSEMQQHLPPNRELVTDKPGRGSSPASGGRHAVAPRTDWHTFEKERFAHQVAETLDHARTEGRFDRLVLVAPPKTLGWLREQLSKPTYAKVTGEIAKDLTNASDADLKEQLGAVMAI
ncbi:host attachment protein [Rhodovibrio salinarum]|uniref:Host attachment protein n=1 Tax=Rhodovibrio salinarum TaxID=1087 RepID=A0A934V180_9PROT|nr:host attachment protein [Rhodovibrio salinarum]MBK1698456.1 host attachment protein [Rhodovibrio salinarum]